MRNTGWNQEVPRVLPTLARNAPPPLWKPPDNNIWPTRRPAFKSAWQPPPPRERSEEEQLQSAVVRCGRPSTAQPRGQIAPLVGDKLRRAELVASFYTAQEGTPQALSSSRAKPRLPPAVPHAQPRVWLLAATPSPRAEDPREAAIRTLNRGVGIVHGDQPRWHARPAISQVFFC